MTEMTHSTAGPEADPINTHQVKDGLPLVAVSLLKGPIHRNRKPDVWALLDKLQPQVRDHMAVLGLVLVIDEAEGYAYLRSVEVPEGEVSPVPRLMARRSLSFPVSLLLALLRKRLAEFDSSGGGETRLILTQEEIVELVRLFTPETTNETKIVDNVERHLNRVIELGFLRRLDKRASTGGQSPRYEVQRILKAYVDGQWLSEFNERLAEYAARLRDGGEDGRQGDGGHHHG